MAIVITNPTGILTSSFGASPRTIAITTPTSGNMLALYTRDSAGGGGETVTDDQSNTYTQITSFTDNNGNVIQIFRSGNLTGTMPTSLSISWGGGGNRQIFVQMVEMSGVDGTTPVDGTTDSGNVFGVTNSVTFTTANANEAAFSYARVNNKDYAITETGFNRVPSTGAVSYSMIYKADLGAAGSGKTCTRTWTGATGADMVLVTFKPAAGPTAYADNLSVGVYSISGKSITDSIVHADSLSAGSYALSGQSITDQYAHNDALSAGSYVITGQSITDVKVGGSTAYADTLSAGAYLITGNALTDSKVIADSLAAGSYTITGVSISDTVARGDLLQVGNYVITGNSITDLKTGATAYFDDLSSGIYNYLGISLVDAYISGSQNSGGYVDYGENKRIHSQKDALLAQSRKVIKKAKKQHPDAFGDAVDVIAEIRAEIENLGIKAEYFERINKQQAMIQAQLAQEQLEAQIEEIDTVFAILIMLAQLD